MPSAATRLALTLLLPTRHCACHTLCPSLAPPLPPTRAAATTELLINRGVPVDVKSNDGNTPLHYACAEGHTAVAEMLIGKGSANVKPKNNKGKRWVSSHHAQASKLSGLFPTTVHCHQATRLSTKL